MNLKATLTSPRLIDALLGLAALEAVVLVCWPRRRQADAIPHSQPRTDDPPHHRPRTDPPPHHDGRRPSIHDLPPPPSPPAKAAARDALMLLLPGACLMLAARAALAGVAWPWVPLALAASGVAHLADLWNRRWTR